MASLSLDTRSTLQARLDERRVKMALISEENKLFPKESLGNACLKWLPVLY